jgi:hypothetical protein
MTTTNNEEKAKELLQVLMNSKEHNPAWALQEVLEKLRNQLSGNDGLYINKNLNTYYLNGREDCLNEIDCIIDELELL